MSRVLLLGDVSSGTGLYHVGDEACFNEIARRLALDNVGIYFANFEVVLPQLSLRGPWFRSVRDGRSSRNSLLRALGEWDALWLVGGGNLCSRFEKYLHHRAAIVSLAREAGLATIATSQGLGPFRSGHDSEVFTGLIKNLKYLSVRDPLASARLCERLGQDCHVCPDDAFSLPLPPHFRLPNAFEKNGRVPAIGLSLRDWDKTVVTKAAATLIEKLGVGCSIHLIPHIIDSVDQSDVGYMRREFEGIFYGLDYFQRTGNRIDAEVARLTSTMELMIASRYHAAVFAVANGVRCIGLFADEYYERKMLGLAAHGFPHFRAVDVRVAPNWAALVRFTSLPFMKPVTTMENTQVILRSAEAA